MYTEIGYMCIYYPLDAEWHDNSLVVMVQIKFLGIKRWDLRLQEFIKLLDAKIEYVNHDDFAALQTGSHVLVIYDIWELRGTFQSYLP